ncbi:MAG: helix-turn-helix transcriptional regulator [Acetobacterium sp.]|nr:helix-turn-helix transcriptional regulator [Acetobacterium sp.]
MADHCHLSKYYLCRVFKAETGEGVYAFIKRLKMEQSAIEMKLGKDKSITDIGMTYGYSSSNYSTAFKKHHHLSPGGISQNREHQLCSTPVYSGSTGTISIL